MAPRVKVNKRGVASLLKEPKVLDDLEARARRIAAAAGPGHEVDASVRRDRARASVRTATYEAMAREAKRRTLTSAVDAGRG